MTKCKVIALTNQKGGTAKTTTTLNLGIGLAHQGRKVLLVDADPQGDLTTALGWTNADSLSITLETQMKKILQDEPFVYNEGILHHEEGVDIIPTNIELSGMEISLVNAMSREQTLKLYLADLKNGKKAGNDRHFDTKGEVYPLAVNEKSVFLCFPSPHPTPFVYKQITSRKDNKEPGTSSLSAGQRFPYPA